MRTSTLTRMLLVVLICRIAISDNNAIADGTTTTIFVYEREIVTYGCHETRSSSLFDSREVGIFLLQVGEEDVTVRQYIDAMQTLQFGRPIAPPPERALSTALWKVDKEFGITSDTGMGNEFVT